MARNPFMTSLGSLAALLLLTFGLLWRNGNAQPVQQPFFQEPVDTTSALQILTDSSAVTIPDTLEPESEEVDTTIAYSASSIEFFVDGKRTVLKGNAQVTYRQMKLRAEKITVDWDNNLIIAEGVSDTIWTDSLQTEVDTVVVVGLPVFSEGEQEIHGEKMTYDLKTRRGRVVEGTTAYQDGYYWGAALKKEPSEVIYVGSGSFTTCSLPDPHYAFRASQMKLIQGDKVVAKPVLLYFGEVPVAAIPYGVFPSRRGRHSGLIIPTYGESAAQGRFIRHLGYYWATNDYSDFTGSLDYYERSGFLFNGRTRYNWRYHLSGTVDGAYINQHFGDEKRRRWELKLGHDQQIDPDTRLRVDANIISDGSYYKDYSFNLNEQLSQTLRSDATLSRTFPGTKNSMSVNLHHEQNLQNDEISQNIPRITFRRGQSAIIPMPEKAPDDTGSVEPRWYHNLYYSYSGEYIHRRVLNQVTADSVTGLVQDRRSAARHNLGFSSPQKLLTYFSINPGINYKEEWFDESLDYSHNPDGEKKIGFAARRTFNSTLGLSTKAYGYWMNPFPGVDAIRHTMTPNLSLSFQPDFSDPIWDYYQLVQEDSSATAKKDRFAGSLYGPTAKGKQLSLGFQLANLFQMKYGSGEEKQKRDLFTLNFSSSYNFEADSLNFSSLRSSFRASPISGNQALGPLQSLSFDLSTSHSFYKYGPGGEYNEFYFDPGRGKILRLQSFDISTNTAYSIGTLIHSPEQVRYDEDQETIGTALEAAQADTTLTPRKKPPLPKEWYLGQIPWDVQLSFHYTSNRYNPDNPSKTFWMNATVDASITTNWQISYNTRVDLIDHKVVSAGLTIYRDLHCWEARLVWNPLGIGQGYFLKINIKSPQLQDVKVEKRKGQGTFMGF